MDDLLRRLVRHAVRRATAGESPPAMQPLPTPTVPSLAAAAAGQPPVDETTGTSSATNDGAEWDLSSLNSTFAENFTMITDGIRDHSTTPRGHVLVDEAWPVYPFTIIKALVLSVILAILLIVTYKVTMQYVIKTWKREKR